MILIEEERFGFLLQLHNFIVVLGNRKFTIENFQKMYPRFQFFGLRQTHSDKIHYFNLKDNSGVIEGDAIISSQSNVAHFIKTADCAPVFLLDKNSGTMAAIHVGWRGVANKIVPKSIAALSEMLKADPSRFDVIIGPHIQKESFEVDLDVRDQLLSSITNYDCGLISSHGDKYLVDLHLLLKIQIQDSGIQADKVNSLLIDTKTNLEFHSFRRDRENSGRQISFVARLT